MDMKYRKLAGEIVLGVCFLSSCGKKDTKEIESFKEYHLGTPCIVYVDSRDQNRKIYHDFHISGEKPDGELDMFDEIDNTGKRERDIIYQIMDDKAKWDMLVLNGTELVKKDSDKAKTLQSAFEKVKRDYRKQKGDKHGL